MTTYRFFSSTDGPASAVSYGGSFLAGLVFQATGGGTWLDGYWWWVAGSGQTTAAGQQFALWQIPYYVNDGDEFSGASANWQVVPGTTATAGTLTAGAWNYVALDSPVLLSQGFPYVLATGFSGDFPATNDQFGSGDPFSAGITAGPVTAYSDQGGSNYVVSGDDGVPQGLFSVAGTDPTANAPNEGSNSANFWIDAQFDDTSTSATYRMWPGLPAPVSAVTGETTGFTIGNVFSLSESCPLSKIWFYSASGAAALPTRCAIWTVSTTTEVSGTDNSSPTWLLPDASPASAGDGWCYADYSDAGVTLASVTDYMVSVFYAGGEYWFAGGGTPFWASGAGSAGLTQGPLSMPAANSWYLQSATWGFPVTEDASQDNWWVDVEVTPAGGTPHTATAALTVTPSFTATAVKTSRNNTATAALTVTPVFSAARAQGHARSAALTVTPRFSAAASGGAARAGASAALFEDERSVLSKLRMLGGWTA